MAGPDDFVGRGDGIVRARIEARDADPLDFDISVKLVTKRSEWEIDGETHVSEATFPVIEVDGYESHDMYRFAVPGTSWSEEDVVEEQTVETVDLSDVDAEGDR
jgi:hypothetical protein